MQAHSTIAIEMRQARQISYARRITTFSADSVRMATVMSPTEISGLRRWARRALLSLDWRWTLIGVLCVNVAIAAFVPIYIDELVYKISTARTFLEGGAQLSLYPQCPDTFVTPLPWALLPGGAVYALAWQSLTLLGMRLLGIAMFAGWLALFHVLVRQLLPARHSRLLLTLCVAALLSLGVTGFSMTISRPEGFLTIALTAVVLLPLIAPGFFTAADSKLARRLRIAGVTALYLLIVSTLAFGHPNVVYFIPLIAISVALTFSRSSWILAAGVMALALWMLVTGVVHSTRVITTCSDPAFREMSRMYLNDVGALLTAPFETIKILLSSLFVGLRQVVQYAAHRDEYQSSWLPATPLLGWLPLSVGLRWLMDLLWHSLALAGIAAILLCLAKERKRNVLERILLAIGLLFGFATLFAHARQLNFTIVQLTLPMLAVFAVLTLSPWLPHLERFPI
ncbi:hypothetical protein, partial [Rhodoplanes sp. SY1]|uniref:hypothetical protein n=1 Tax=Rhodoplanes sp. SY1 TaxID=3166646 RepID=UPI0038B4C8A6